MRVKFRSFWSRSFVGMVASVRVCVLVAGVILLATGQRPSGQNEIVTVQLDPSRNNQTIDGFGVAQVRYGPWHPWDKGPADPPENVYSHPGRSHLMDVTFSALHGIGATRRAIRASSGTIGRSKVSETSTETAGAICSGAVSTATT
jgi:hypothetical protein